MTMFGLCLISLVATVCTGAFASHTAATIARDLRRETFAKVMQFSPAEVNKFSQASLITRCTNDIQQVQMATTLFMRLVLFAPSWEQWPFFEYLPHQQDLSGQSALL